MTKRKTKIALLILSLLAFIGGICANYFFSYDISSDDNFLKENLYTLLLTILPAGVVLIGLWFFDKIRRLLEFPKTSVKPFVCLGFVLYIGTMIAFGFMNANAGQRFRYTLDELGFILFALAASCLLIEMFLIDVDDTKKEVLFDDYKIRFRHWNWPNSENVPVTIKNKMGKLLGPETYFENEEYRELFNTNSEYIFATAQEEAKKAIFEQELEKEISGEWYLSRIDFHRGDGFSYPKLDFYMNFITKTVKSYRLYGLVELSKRVVESDYCRINCSFDYKESETENPFSFKETEVELIYHFI